LLIGASRDEGFITNQFYDTAISLAAGWQQYAANSAFKVDLLNYGVQVKGLLQPLSAGTALCNIPQFLRPIDSRRIPCVFATGITSGESQAVATVSPESNLSLVSDPTSSIAWLSLDGVSWKFY
jgi:hypothetical protein